MKIVNKTNGEIGAYAEAELKKHIEAVCGRLPEITFILQTAPEMAEYSYSFDGTGDSVLLTGPRENEVLLAVYLALDEMGIVFDTKTRYPAKLDFTKLSSKKTVRPFARLRGIRQHINFPMDISSYHLEDAKEYIRSLARMRMNAITFHSYDGMWHNKPGHFFYGRVHKVPTQDYIQKAVHNRNYYMIPECEALYGNEEAVGKYAIYWLNELMKTAKECGLHITMSIEPAKDVHVTEEMLAYYPLIDTLELISPEGGGEADRPHTETADIKAHAVQLFGDKILDENGRLPGLDESAAEHSSAIYATMDSLKRAMDHLPYIKNVPVRIGLYVLCPETLYIVKRIMDKVLPGDMIQTFLPAHGAEAVTEVTRSMEFAPDDFQKTVLHSWVEFDGNMYISQNASNAIGRMCSWIQEYTGAPSVHALYFNHWRTEENRIALAYAAACTEAPIEVKCWYAAYSERFGVSSGKTFAEIMYKTGELDIFCRNTLFNIGFCFLPCWTNHFGINWIKGWTAENTGKAREGMKEIIHVLQELLADTTNREGIDLLRFLINRYETSVHHLDMIDAMNKIRDSQEPSFVKAALEEAAEHADLYMRKMCEMMPDRGCQGQLVSYAFSMPGYIEHLRKCYLGVSDDSHEQTQQGDTVTPPPAPV